VETILTPDAVRVIQLSLAPIFLIVGIGNLVNVATGRLTNIIERARWLEEQAREDPKRINQKMRREIRSLNQRMKYSGWTINLLVAAAVVTCFDVMLLFFNGLVNTNLNIFIFIIFMVSMMLLTAGLIAFFLEVSAATSALKEKIVDFKRFKRGS